MVVISYFIWDTHINVINVFNINSEFMKGTGRIIYDPRRGNMKRRIKWWCVLEVDGGAEIVRYFRWWIDHEIVNPFNIEGAGLEPQSWAPHVSIIRGEPPENNLAHLWKKYQGKRVEFDFDFVDKFKVGTNNKGNAPGMFFLVDVHCPFLIDIRKEFGFPCNWNLHMTFGRTYA